MDASPRCVAAASAAAKASKGDLTERDVLDAFDRIDAQRMKLDQTGQASGPALQKFAAEEAERAKIAAAMLKRNTAINVIVGQKIDAHLDGLLDAGIEPQHAMLAMIDGTMKPVKNARKSLMAEGQTLQAVYTGGMMSELQKAGPHLLQLLSSDALDHDIKVEMSEIRPDGNPGSTGNRDAKMVASIFSKYRELMRTDSNRLGGSVGKLEGSSGVQTHDDIKMIQAGKNAWVGFVATHLDADRTFPGMGADGVAKALGDVYDTIITGISDKPVNEGRVNPASLANSLGKSRVLHFNGVDAEQAYADRFGYGNTISGMLAQARRFEKINAAMTVFGPNPEYMVHATAERLKQKLKASPTLSDEEKSKLNNALDTQAGPIRHALDIATGLNSRPVNVTFGKIAGDIRAAEGMSKYGGSLISSLGDPITTAAASQFRGSGFLKGLMTQWGGVMQGRSRGEQAEISYMLGEGYKGLVAHIHNANFAVDGVVGKMARWQEQFFKWNGLTWWTDVNREVAARTISAEMGMKLGKGFDELDPRYRRVMDMQGINADQWGVMQKAALTAPNGSPYMTPDLIQHLSDADVAPLIGPGQTADDARRDLQRTLLRYVADETANSHLEQDNRVKRTVTWGTRPGTLAGEAIRFVMQAKSYPVAFSQRVLGRALFGFESKNALHLNPFSPKFDPASIAGEQGRHIGTLLTGLAAAGYLTLVAKDTLHGYWPPRDPLDPSTWIASMQTSGGLGVYGDYLFAAKAGTGGDVLNTAAGPTIGDISSLVALGVQARNYAIGKLQDDPSAKFSGNAAISKLLSMVPYANMYYAKPVLDYLFLNSLREWAKPGYLRQLARSRQKDYGQTQVFPQQFGAN